MCVVCVEYVCISDGEVKCEQKYISVVLNALESQPVLATELIS